MVILFYIRKVPNFYPKQLPPCVMPMVSRAPSAQFHARGGAGHCCALAALLPEIEAKKRPAGAEGVALLGEQHAAGIVRAGPVPVLGRDAQPAPCAAREAQLWRRVT
jgi:hypothetical protein